MLTNGFDKSIHKLLNFVAYNKSVFNELYVIVKVQFSIWRKFMGFSVPGARLLNSTVIH